MTVTDRSRPATSSGDLAPLLEVRWASQVDGPSDFVINLQPVDRARAIIAAWLESGCGRRVVLRRRSAPCTITEDDHMLHLDVRIEGRRAIAISLPRDGRGPHYVHCDLGPDAGLGAGGVYDPPTVRRLAEPGAATA